jgi:multidrug efflux pump subunit AcrA (membrane-fusion protein)
MVIKITPDLAEPATVRQVIWQVDNRVGLLEPGTYRKVRLHANTTRKCLAVPVAAFTDESHERVAVVESDGSLGFRDVKTGITNGTYIEIISGLQAGDIVITSDTEGVTAGTEVELTLEEN